MSNEQLLVVLEKQTSALQAHQEALEAANGVFDHHEARFRVQQRTISSLLDVVQELAWAAGEPDWAEIVEQTFAKHRRELLTGEIEEE